MSDRFFDKEGKPISLRFWGELYENIEYRFLRDDRFLSSNGVECHVVTVWLGDNFEDELRMIDMDAPGYLPRVFGTMILGGISLSGENQEIRHCTEQQAIERHELIVAALKSGDPVLLSQVQKILEQDGV